MIWHSSSAQDVLKELQVDDKTGLANGVADMLLEENGQNVISKIERPSFLNRFLQQFKSKTVITLIILSVISFIVSLVYNQVNAYSSLLIIGIVAINALISAYHLHSCDNTLDNIKQITNPTVNVLREGILKSINAAFLVPGDIIILEEGDYIPADARIIEANEFRCNESTLTMVEVPVEKSVDEIHEDITPIERRSNMVFCGTSVAHGTAKAVVVTTGLNTEIGKNSAISQQTGEDKLPIQDKLDNIGNIVNVFVLIVCLIVFVIGMFQNFSSQNFASTTVQMLINAVALAVAAIPEGLPAIATIVIAIGMHRILQDNIVLKDASAAELLGKTDVLCCDKTGVITHNRMMLSRIFDGKNLIDVTSEALDEKASTVLKIAAACSTLSNDATEDAIEKACLTYNSMSKYDVDAMFPHISEIPFDSDRKTMTVITMINEKPFAIVKGAAEMVVPNCDTENKEKILKLNEAMADEALRIVCIAMKPLNEIPANPNPEDIERGLTFVGLLGLEDPPRSTAAAEIAACEAAGIKTIMVTGDNLITATKIAEKVGILKQDTLAITGAELDEMSDEELVKNIEKYSVFARVSPSHKLRIVKAYQQLKKIITVTGDSVQDAEALAIADVGCAIGKHGADVAKGNADIVIDNNRFNSIIYAIRESRGLFSNIKKSIYYLFSCNFAEILTIIFGLLIFKCMPIAAAQLLWINLLTDSAPAISLSMENAEKDIMNTKSVSGFGRIFDYKSVLLMLSQSIVIVVITLLSFGIGNDFGDTSTAMTMAFATLGISQIFNCINNKFIGSVFAKTIFKNRFMNYSIAITLFVLLFLIFTPAGFLFGLTILSAKQFIICFAFALSVIPITEGLKLLMRKI